MLWKFWDVVLMECHDFEILKDRGLERIKILGFRISESHDFRISGFQNFRIPEFRNPRISESQTFHTIEIELLTKTTPLTQHKLFRMRNRPLTSPSYVS